MRNNIILCGFMGCGKTSLGSRLAQQYSFSFLDTDIYLENKFGMTIPEIFSKYGEQRFREMEKEVVQEISSEKNRVIACGGGTILNQENVGVFRDSGGMVLFLDVPLQTLQERLKNDTQRPLLQQPNRNEIIARLYDERIHRYREAADIIIDANASLEIALKRIAEKAGL